MDKYSILKQYYGHGAFRAGQEELIDSILSGRDALCVMPTGGGKSLCYQIPALLLPGITLVVSPLISLMKDQVAALKSAGVPAAYINSSLTGEQIHTVYARTRKGVRKIFPWSLSQVRSQQKRAPSLTRTDFLLMCRL